MVLLGLGAWQTFLIAPLDVFATLAFQVPCCIPSACPPAYVITINKLDILSQNTDYMLTGKLNTNSTLGPDPMLARCVSHWDMIV